MLSVWRCENWVVLWRPLYGIWLGISYRKRESERDLWQTCSSKLGLHVVSSRSTDPRTKTSATMGNHGALIHGRYKHKHTHNGKHIQSWLTERDALLRPNNCLAMPSFLLHTLCYDGLIAGIYFIIDIAIICWTLLLFVHCINSSFVCPFSLWPLISTALKECHSDWVKDASQWLLLLLRVAMAIERVGRRWIWYIRCPFRHSPYALAYDRNTHVKSLNLT